VVKDVKIYFIGLKKDLFGCFRIEENVTKDNETSLKEEGGIEMSTTVLPFTITIITIYYSEHNKHLKLEKNNFYDNYNLVYSDTTKFQLFDF
jgi:hypothetical protein